MLNITLGANEFKSFRKGGAAFEIIVGDYPITVNLYSDMGGHNNTINNVISGFFLNAKYGAFDIKNGSTAQTVQILCMDLGESGGSRRQPGVVQVTDSGKVRTIANQSFAGRVGQAPTAGLLPNVQIWNPIGSNKRVSVKSLTLTSNISTGIYIFLVQTAKTDYQALPSKLSGGAASSARIQLSSESAAYLNLISASWLFKVAPNISASVLFQEPFCIEPGWGFSMCTNVADAIIDVGFEFIEELKT